MLTETKRLLCRDGIWLDRRLGQNQVIDASILKKMIDYAEVTKNDKVLEIGAGVGNLTVMLAEAAGTVTAIERDKKLIRILKERLKGRTNVKVLQGDALEMELPEFNKIVSNLPFSISSRITFKLLGLKFDIAVLMFQKEFAERLVASPGSKNYGRLTVNVYYRAKAELLDEVPPSAFFPQPKVSSAIVRLKPRQPPFEIKDEQLFSRVVRALFQHRNQRVRNALLHSFSEIFPKTKMTKNEIKSFIGSTLPGKFLEARVPELTPEDLGEITNLLTSP
ncbi:MAG: 16S rRNA (adenine(1518)-N(6)/adenine(1519)-N(6))-dimethyltransferase RsmA [Candidatus Hadarchaeum sp.]|uniref:16S rRNA (adenine(1518)-N(6)/adenine(1519)-N(6))- dimethyltransferase RsmA n=1 Tax=Candidatus Hadarchaeum sp. TaxID=2883567 RepID=UPI00318266E3